MPSALQDMCWCKASRVVVFIDCNILSQLYSFCMLLCRMKMLECKRRGMYDVGFIDPYIVNEIMLQRHPKDVEHDLYAFLTKQNLRSDSLFLYNFK
jgi:hypothetical protein